MKENVTSFTIGAMASIVILFMFGVINPKSNSPKMGVESKTLIMTNSNEIFEVQKQNVKKIKKFLPQRYGGIIYY